MNQRLLFVQRCARRVLTISEVCAEFGISRKTGHKWLARFAAAGVEGLEDGSHAPRTIAHRVSSELVNLIVRERRAHSTYGPKKIRRILERRHPNRLWPAESTIGEILKRAGLVSGRRKRRPPTWRQASPGRSPARGPNDVWTADFKGEFRYQSGGLCYPLTVVDSYSRYLLGCVAQPSTRGGETRRNFARVFREYGLPRVLRTDNGTPFAHANALGRLSTLSVWWIKLGIRPELIRPGRPAENGRHERMHRTLKHEATRPASASQASQQRRFNAFRRRYNNDRPHEGLGLETPASCYRESTRSYPGDRLGPVEYAGSVKPRMVSSVGYIKVKNQPVFLSAALAGEYVGLEDIGEDTVRVMFGRALLGELDCVTFQLTPLMQWRVEDEQVV